MSKLASTSAARPPCSAREPLPINGYSSGRAPSGPSVTRDCAPLGRSRAAAILLLAVFLVPLSPAFAQSPTAAPQVQTNELQVLTTQLAPVISVSSSITGNAGNASYYYWVIAKYASGDASPSPAVFVSPAPSPLNGSNFVTL